MKPKRQFILVVLLVIMPLGFSLFAQNTVVEKHGLLRVEGNRIVNAEDTPVAFAGNSLFWSNEGWGGEAFYTKQVVEWLKEEWNTTIIRAAMGVDASGGYLENKESQKAKVSAVVDACIEQGLYVIIDWHSHHAHEHKAEAVAFFKEMASQYGESPNVIYEIYNEPVRVSWKKEVKPYSEEVIAAIREADPDNLILVGSPHWAQDVDIASEDPITGYENLAYTLHFYAATHKESLRKKAQKALDNGIALFVSEYGTCEASGDGKIDEASLEKWMDFMKQNHISHCNWAVNDKKESASVLKEGASATGNWRKEDLKTSGKLVKEIIQDWNADLLP